MALVTAFRKRDGEKVRVPEHWLTHPVLGGSFSRTKPVKAKAVEVAVSDSKKKESKNA